MASPSDPRWLQIAALASLIVYGRFELGLAVAPEQVLVSVGTAFGVQAGLSRWVGLPQIDLRSAAITGLGTSLLLRVDALWVAAFCAAVAIGSKFVLRSGDRHWFNPGLFGIVAAVGLTGRAWVSPGQWGSNGLIATVVACGGLWVVHRSVRSDVTLAFLAGWAGVLFGRALWLGDPLSIPLHQLQNGATVIFAFFMISDPKTTPRSRLARVLFGLAVAAGAGWWQFGWWREAGPIWSLFLLTPLVPLLDRLLPGGAFSWSNPTSSGDVDDKLVAA